MAGSAWRKRAEARFARLEIGDRDRSALGSKLLGHAVRARRVAVGQQEHASLSRR